MYKKEEEILLKLKKSLLHGTLSAMRNRWKSFIFENWEWNTGEQKLSLRYSFDGDVSFEENWWFDGEMNSAVPQHVLNKAFEGLWIAAGVSYFKAALPQKIVFRSEPTNNKLQTSNISKSQAEFFEKVWRNGLGEFFFQNKIDPEGVVNFQFSNYNLQTTNTKTSLALSGALLPIGGGKDSLVSAILLREGNVDFETWTVGDSAVQTACCDALSVPRMKVHRQIAPELLRLNAEGALNGHVPISSILAFAGVVSALLRGKKYVVFSNEHSASEPNTNWKGLEINHQWSKSLDFENEFQQYVSKNISPQVQYFSLLRPLTELRIAEIFAKKGWDEFGALFSSCNRNFHITGSKISSRWCGKCPKCVFVSLILSPWLSAKQIEGALGTVPFAQRENEMLMKELLGLQGIKPLECVGTIVEAREAVVLGTQKHECLKSWMKKFDISVFDFQKMNKHLLPPKFEVLLKEIA